MNVYDPYLTALQGDVYSGVPGGVSDSEGLWVGD